MHDKTNIYTCKERLYSGLKSRYSNDRALFALWRFIMRETAFDILFTFDKLGVLMQFSCHHMPYVSNTV